MKTLRTLLPSLLRTLAPSLLLLCSCETESYESGNTQYSYMQADFADAHSSEVGKLDRCTTDEGLQLTFAPEAEAKWVGTADSTYRILAYYDNREVGAPSGSATAKTVKPLAISRVPVLTPKAPDEFEGGFKNDPLTLQSCWTSANGRYLNLDLVYKTGIPDDEKAVQSVGMAIADEQADTITLEVFHDQGGVPEYYSSRMFVSVALNEQLSGKVIRLRVNTYQGTVERIF